MIVNIRERNENTDGRYPSLWPSWNLPSIASHLAIVTPDRDDPLIYTYTCKVNHPDLSVHTVILKDTGDVLFNAARTFKDNQAIQQWINANSTNLVAVAKQHGQMLIVGQLVPPARFHVYYMLKAGVILLDEFTLRYHLDSKHAAWEDSLLHVVPASAECPLIIDQKRGQMDWRSITTLFDPGTPIVGFAIDKSERRSGICPRMTSNPTLMRFCGFTYSGVDSK